VGLGAIDGVGEVAGDGVGEATGVGDGAAVGVGEGLGVGEGFAAQAREAAPNAKQTTQTTKKNERECEWIFTIFVEGGLRCRG